MLSLQEPMKDNKMDEVAEEKEDQQGLLHDRSEL